MSLPVYARASALAVLCALIPFSGHALAQPRAELITALSEGGWTLVGDFQEYDDPGLAQLAGPVSETVRRYGFIEASRQRLRKGSDEVRLTLYRMIDSAAAYGVFSLVRNPSVADYSPIPVGAEGYQTARGVHFWQADYYGVVEGPEAEAVGRELGRAIVGRSRKPPVSTLLPPEGRIAGTDRYIVDATSVPRALGLQAAALGFDDSVEMALARYRISGATVDLVLLLYPTQQVARKYMDQWTETEAGPLIARRRSAPLVAIVRGSSNPEVVSALLDQVNYESEVTWNEPKEDIQVSDIIITAFIFIGIALLMTVGAGIGFGGLRVFLKARYPGRVFDRVQDNEIIQLKLTKGVNKDRLPE